MSIKGPDGSIGVTQAEEIAQAKLPEIITAARAFGADKAFELFAAALESYARERVTEEREKCGADTQRLNWLESHRLGLNRHYGTSYGWKFVANHNVTRLFVGDVNTIDLHDSEANAGNIRQAIDDAIAARIREGNNG